MLGALRCDTATRATKCSRHTDQHALEAGSIQTEDSAHAQLTRFLRFGAISALNLKVYLAVLLLQGSISAQHTPPDWSTASLSTCQDLWLRRCCRPQCAGRFTVTVTLLLEGACQ